MKIKLFLLILITLFTTILSSQEKVVGVIENDADSKPISNVHVINLNKVVGVISNKDGEFEIQAEVNDTLYFSYLGFKSIKINVYIYNFIIAFIIPMIQVFNTYFC